MTFFKDFILFLALYLGAVSYGAVYLMTVFSKSIQGDEGSVGIFLALAGAATLLVTGFSGKLANKIGADKTCFIGTVLVGASFIVLASRESIDWVYYLSGFVIGFGWSIFYAAGPMLILGCVPAEQKGRYISLISVCIVCGTATLPIVYDLVQNTAVSIANILFITALISGVSAVLCILAGMMFQTKKTDGKPSTTQQNEHSLSFFEMFKTDAKYSLIMVFLGACIFSSMMNFQTSYAETKGLNFSVFYGFYMISVIGCRILFGSILTAKNPIAPTPLLLLLMLSGLILMALNENSIAVYAISATLLGVSYGLVYPLIKTHAVNNVSAKNANNVVAYFTLMYFIGVYFFPFVGGFVIKHLGYSGFITLLIAICSVDVITGLLGYKKTKTVALKTN